jgi:predicted DNA-binding transcriptional regulator YafY
MFYFMVSQKEGISMVVISKTERILAIFHLLTYCREITFKEVTDLIPVSNKTVYRDIRLLRRIGCNIVFSRTLGAFVMSKEVGCQTIPANKTQWAYQIKIARLLDMMREMPSADDPVVWYRTRYSHLSMRTMQRDFKILNGIGYKVEYEREKDNREGRPTGKYYCEWPAGT